MSTSLKQLVERFYTMLVDMVDIVYPFITHLPLLSSPYPPPRGYLFSLMFVKKRKTMSTMSPKSCEVAWGAGLAGRHWEKAMSLNVYNVYQRLPVEGSQEYF